MTSSICKVKNNQLMGTGFFCVIPYKNNTKIKVLITSSEIIDECYLNQNTQINLLMNDYNELKTIDLDPSRKFFSNKEYKTTIIELKDSDNINSFLELDDNLFRNDIKSLYEKESIYILQYLYGGKSSVSYGIFNELNGINIKHRCTVDSGSNGAPILNLTNNKVVGVSLNEKDTYFNKGIILKYSIEEFINGYQNSFQQMNNMLNNNFQNMGMGITNMNNFMPNNMLNNNFIPFPNMMMNNNFIPFPNMMVNNNWIMNNNLNNNNLCNIEVNEKINVKFRNDRGITTNVCVDFGTTVDQLLTIYLKRTGRQDLIGNNKRIVFLFNANRMKFGDQTDVKEKFKNVAFPLVSVNFYDIID